MDDGPDQDPMVPSSRVIMIQVYLVRGGSRPNLTEGSLSAAMGFEHTGAGHNHNIVMPSGSESLGSEGPES
ncbi:hypothetical protein M5K25_026533 [Dendrobium thyrsiflorum]|uniref:Uncharacterized protein n=1 Tax=Dendrobium thyrsiflorum TaxID=117978 RepID=A0ABD0TXL7_DENTH